MPPEVEVFGTLSVQALIREKYDIDVDWLLQRDDVKDHHKIVESIAQEAEAEPEVVRTVAIEQYIKTLDTEFDPLIECIEAALA